MEYGDILVDTELGKDIEKFERQISKYFVVEYSKNVSDDNAVIYLPGQLDSFEKEQKKDFRMFLKPYLHPDLDTMKLEYSVKLGIDYRDVDVVTEYNISNQGTTVTFENELINSYIGGAVSISIIRDNNKQMSGFFLISLEF